MIIITCWKLLMGLRDCSSPAPASRTFDVIVLAPPGTSSGVDALQPCEEWLSLAAISIFFHHPTNLFVRLLHPGLHFTRRRFSTNSRTKIFSWKEWMEILSSSASSEQTTTLHYHFPALSSSTSPSEEWSMNSRNDAWSCSHFSHLAHMQLPFRMVASVRISDDPLGDLMLLPLGTSAMSLLTWTNLAWKMVYVDSA